MKQSYAERIANGKIPSRQVGGSFGAIARRSG